VRGEAAIDLEAGALGLTRNAWAVGLLLRRVHGRAMKAGTRKDPLFEVQDRML